MKHLYKVKWLMLLLLFIHISCRKFVQINPPSDQLVSSQVFTDSVNATSAIIGMYTLLTGLPSYFNFGNGSITAYTGLTSDELITQGFLNPSDLEFYNNSITVRNPTIAGPLWTNSYQIIYDANACIEGCTSSNGLSTNLKNQLIGEAKVVRAFCFFNLVNLYGGVPLVISTDYHVNDILPRASTDSIYEQIIFDLTSSQKLLSIQYPSSGKVRPNQYVATALLARVYLYLKQWENAEISASQVINSGNYRLEPELGKVFLPQSNEAIWQLPPSSGYETAEGTLFVPTDSTVVPNYIISNYLLNAFEDNDQRRVNWVDSNVVNSQVSYFPFKYKLGIDNSSTPSEFYMIFRGGEQYLIRAEAEANGAHGGISAAISDLNTIRNRAGLTNYNGPIDQNSVLNAIYHERQVELFCEWGHRWYDLKRTNRADNILKNEKAPNWKAKDTLYPIPIQEMLINPGLKQNEGY